MVGDVGWCVACRALGIRRWCKALGEILGEIDTGQGSIFEELNGSPILIPNALGFDTSGNIFLADTALDGGAFELPFEDKSGVWMIPAGALDDLADGKRPAQLPVFLAEPEHPDGVEVSPLDGKIYVNTVAGAVGAPGPAGGGLYALTMSHFKSGELPEPMDRDLGALDGLDFTRGGRPSTVTALPSAMSDSASSSRVSKPL